SGDWLFLLNSNGHVYRYNGAGSPTAPWGGGWTTLAEISGRALFLKSDGKVYDFSSGAPVALSGSGFTAMIRSGDWVFLLNGIDGHVYRYNGAGSPNAPWGSGWLSMTEINGRVLFLKADGKVYDFSSSSPVALEGSGFTGMARSGGWVYLLNANGHVYRYNGV